MQMHEDTSVDAVDEVIEGAGDLASPAVDVDSGVEIEIVSDAPVEPSADERAGEAVGSLLPTEATEAEAADDTGADTGTGADTEADADAADDEPESKPRSRRKPAVPEALPRQTLAARVEALLIASDRPLPERRLAELIGLSGAGPAARVRAALEELDEVYAATGRAFRVRRLAGGWQLVTVSSFGPLMERLHADRQASRLSPAALETLAIVAYRQPVVRAELEAIRGVACGEVLRSLMEKRLVAVVGRAEELGRPMLYGTTRRFLEVFGLGGLDELPAVEGLERRRPRRTTADRHATEASQTDERTDVDAPVAEAGPTDVESGVDPERGPEADLAEAEMTEATVPAGSEVGVDAEGEIEEPRA